MTEIQFSSNFGPFSKKLQNTNAQKWMKPGSTVDFHRSQLGTKVNFHSSQFGLKVIHQNKFKKQKKRVKTYQSWNT